MNILQDLLGELKVTTLHQQESLSKKSSEKWYGDNGENCYSSLKHIKKKKTWRYTFKINFYFYDSNKK